MATNNSQHVTIQSTEEEDQPQSPRQHPPRHPHSNTTTKTTNKDQQQRPPLSPPRTRTVIIENANNRRISTDFFGTDALNFSQSQEELLLSGETQTTLRDSHTFTSRTEEKMRRRLKYYFMNPWHKYKAKGRIPYKLMVQVLKIVLVTIQVILFGYNSTGHVDFTENNTLAFHHLFLDGWDFSMETPPYPASHGPNAVYLYEELYAKINHAAKRYNNTKKVALGSYDFANVPNMTFCKEFYHRGNIFANNQTYIYDSSIDTICVPFKTVQVPDPDGGNGTIEDFDIEILLKQNNITLNFDRIRAVWLDFSLTAIQLKSFDLDLLPDCFRFDIKIYFDNTKHDGQILVKLTAIMHDLKCSGVISRYEGQEIRITLIVLDILVILLCFLSFASCARSLWRGRKIYLRAEKFFRNYMRSSIRGDRLQFLDGWLILILINDVLIVAGCVMKLQLETKVVCNPIDDSSSYKCESRQYSDVMSIDYNFCSYLLGTGSMLVWIGVLRYVGYSYENNILILTLIRALPKIMRFMLCAMVMFLAFSLGGWVVLGPYHVKFRDFITSLECLFALINGDDLFATFSFITADDGMFIYVFSRVYIYLFASLFIYVVLNLFITIVIEAYDSVKSLRHRQGRPLTTLWSFIEECTDHPDSRLYRTDDHENAQIKRQQRMAQRRRSFTNSWRSVNSRQSNFNPISSHNQDNVNEENLFTKMKTTLKSCCCCGGGGGTVAAAAAGGGGGGGNRDSVGSGVETNTIPVHSYHRDQQSDEDEEDEFEEYQQNEETDEEDVYSDSDEVLNTNQNQQVTTTAIVNSSHSINNI